MFLLRVGSQVRKMMIGMQTVMSDGPNVAIWQCYWCSSLLPLLLLPMLTLLLSVLLIGSRVAGRITRPRKELENCAVVRLFICIYIYMYIARNKQKVCVYVMSAVLSFERSEERSDQLRYKD